MPTEIVTVLPFVGWLRGDRRGEHWRVVCQADTYSACWDKLLAVRAATQHCEKVVLSDGRRP
jgi:hypothetical protein